MAITNNTLELFKNNFKCTDFLQCGIDDNKNGYINYIISITQCSREEAIEIIKNYDLYIEPPKQTYSQTLNQPKCPTCSSTKLSKISTMSKAGSVAMFGLLSQKVKKQFHCNNCGYEW